jgi:hypothetical protein
MSFHTKKVMHFFLVKCATLPQNFTLRGAARAPAGPDLGARSHKKCDIF